MKVLLKEEWKVHNDLWNGMLKLENLYNEFFMVKKVKLYDKQKNKSVIYEAKDNKIVITDLLKVKQQHALHK